MTESSELTAESGEVTEEKRDAAHVNNDAAAANAPPLPEQGGSAGDATPAAAPVSDAPRPPPLAGEETLHILCVDDEENILKTLTRLFRGEPFKVLTATSGKAGLEIIRSTRNIGLILSDQRMPEMTGTEFLKEAAEIVPDTPRMILTGYADVHAAIDAINQGGAQRFLMKPWNENELRLAVRDGLQRYHLIRENVRLSALVIKQKDELAEWNSNLKSRVLQQTGVIRKQLEEAHQQKVKTQSTSDAIINMFADLLDQRHFRLSRHSRTVAALADVMTRALNLPQAQREEIRDAALLHDIGLLCVSDKVIAKSAEQLGADDLAEYRAHTVRGEAVMEVFPELKGMGGMIRHHHEDYDGSGFPDGLKGERIPLGARIIHLASFIEQNYAPDLGIAAKYQLTRKLSAGMGGPFDPALAVAANLAVQEVLVESATKQAPVEQEVLLKDLKIGMIMTRDIYNSHGLLIVERGTLNTKAMESIKRHQLSIPLNRIAHVQKSSV